MKYKEISKRVNLMGFEDQEMRRAFRKGESWDSSVAERNVEELKKIVLEIGWPTIDKVGESASKNAWLIVQHVEDDIAFQKRCLSVMAEEFDKNPDNIDRSFLAYLEDRILINSRQQQIYGTQVDSKGEPLPIMDSRNVDKRRKELGMVSMDEYLDNFK